MYHAVYYPHSTIRDKHFLKSSLLLWDELDLIVPQFGTRNYPFDDPDANLGVELLVRRTPPSDRELDAVHSAVVELLSGPIPPWFQLDYDPPDAALGREYAIYTSKMRGDTWELLQASGLARHHRMYPDMEVSGALGLFLMSLFADVRAGQQRRMITDRTEAYAALARYQVLGAASSAPDDPDPGAEADAFAVLVPLGVRVVNTRDIPLRRLVDLRRREQTEAAGADLRALRHNYVKHIDDFVRRYANPLNTDDDRRVVITQYLQELESASHGLRSELGGARGAAFSTTEVFTTIAATAALVAGLVTGSGETASLGTLAGLSAAGGVRLHYRAARRRALLEGGNPASWLYTAKPRRLEVWR